MLLDSFSTHAINVGESEGYELGDWLSEVGYILVLNEPLKDLPRLAL